MPLNQPLVAALLAIAVSSGTQGATPQIVAITLQDASVDSSKPVDSEQTVSTEESGAYANELT